MEYINLPSPSAFITKQVADTPRKPAPKVTIKDRIAYVNSQRQDPNYITYIQNGSSQLQFNTYAGVIVPRADRAHYLRLLIAEYDYLKAQAAYLAALEAF